MNEENKFGPKNKWTRIFRKKWFFPSLYLTLAALLISAVVWYQNTGNDQAEQDIDVILEQSEDYAPIADEDAVPVMDQQEVVQMPIANPEEAEIVTKFFDYEAEESEKENALIHYNNRYYQSTGVDIAQADNEGFDVVASLSGMVTEVKQDPLMGNIVVLEHGNDITTYYASLDEVSVEAGSEVKQGDVVGTAGRNIFGSDKGTHVHFEIQMADKKLNPETYFNQPAASFEQALETAEDEADEASEADEPSEDEVPYSEEPEETEEETEEETDMDRDEEAGETRLEQ